MDDSFDRWSQTSGRGLWLRHSPGIDPEQLLAAIDRHRENVELGLDHCEHVGPGSSVSRVTLAGGAGLDLAVKWNHWRGWRAAASDGIRGSRALRAVSGAARLAAEGISQAEPIAIAERRRGFLVFESFLFTGFVAGALPLSAAMPGMREDAGRRRRVVSRVGETIGRLHAAGLDHRDLKHSNLLLTADDDIAVLDLDSVLAARPLDWRRRVRALGQLEAYASDLYPWLPRSDRARFLRAYFRHDAAASGDKRRLIADVGTDVERRLAAWSLRDRSDSMRYPLKPR